MTSCGISYDTLWTALTAVGTIAMAIATFCSLRQNDKLLDENKKQLEEMKRQWEEDNKPKFDIKLIASPSIYALFSTSIQIYNYGKSLANNVKISFEDEFLNSIPIESLKEYLFDIQTKRYRILPEKSIIIPFCYFIENREEPGYVLCDSKIGLYQKYELEDFFRTPFKLFVTCDGSIPELVEITLSYNDISPRSSSIQEELNHIQIQIASFRSAYQNKN